MREGEVLIILCRVGKDPALVAVGADLPSFQRLVGGNIEAHRLGGRVYLFCNEDGMRQELPANRLVYPLGLIVGDFLLTAGDAQGETVSLSREEIAEWSATAQGWERVSW